jgi:hypothetical protein
MCVGHCSGYRTRIGDDEKLAILIIMHRGLVVPACTVVKKDGRYDDDKMPTVDGSSGRMCDCADEDPFPCGPLCFRPDSH